MNSSRVLPLAFCCLFALPTRAAPRPDFNAANTVSPRSAFREVPADAPPARVTSFDAQTGAPTFLLAGPQAKGTLRAAKTLVSPESAARFWLSRQASRYAVSEKALENETVRRVHDLGRGRVVVTLRQELGGVEVFHSDTKVLLDRGLR